MARRYYSWVEVQRELLSEEQIAESEERAQRFLAQALPVQHWRPSTAMIIAKRSSIT